MQTYEWAKKGHVFNANGFANGLVALQDARFNPEKCLWEIPVGTRDQLYKLADADHAQELQWVPCDSLKPGDYRTGSAMEDARAKRVAGQNYRPVRGFSPSEVVEHERNLKQAAAIFDNLPYEVINKRPIGALPLYDPLFYIHELQIMSGKLNLVKDAVTLEASHKNRKERLDTVRGVLEGTYTFDGQREPLSPTEKAVFKVKEVTSKIFGKKK